MKRHVDPIRGKLTPRQRHEPLPRFEDMPVIELPPKLVKEIFERLTMSKQDIIRAHPDLHPREIRKRYGISVNHVRVQRAQDKKSGKLK